MSNNEDPFKKLRPNKAQWQVWREGENATYWQAAMLSLNLEANLENKRNIYSNDNELFKEASREISNRIKIFRRRRETYPALKAVGDLDKTKRNQMVSLRGVVDFLKEEEKPGAEEFSRLIGFQDIVKTLSGDVVYISRHDEVDDFSDGNKKTLVRYAALVHMLCMAVEDYDEFKLKFLDLFNHKKVTNNELGKAVERTVVTFAFGKSNDKNLKVQGFRFDKNADEISLSKKIKDSYF